LETWLENFRATAGEKVPLIVVESKADVVQSSPCLRKVLLFQALEWCAARGLEHRVVSASEQRGVEALFEEAARVGLAYRRSLPEDKNPPPVEIYYPAEKKKSCYC